MKNFNPKEPFNELPLLPPKLDIQASLKFGHLNKNNVQKLILF